MKALQNLQKEPFLISFMFLLTLRRENSSMNRWLIKPKIFPTVETLLRHYFSQDYFNRSDYLLEKCNSKWALEFELTTLVSSQKSKLQHWAEKWDSLDPKILKEIARIGEMKNGILVTKELFPLLHEWKAKHIYSLPVHNALAERQFSITSSYLDPNMSEESIQATQLFVQNIIHKKGAKKLRTTTKTREEYKTRMTAYTKTVINPSSLLRLNQH